MSNRARLLALAPVLVLVACSSSVPVEDRVQRVSFCEGLGRLDEETGRAPTLVTVDFRTESDLVASSRVAPGTVVTHDVPLGTVAVYVDTVLRGTVSAGVAADEDDPYVPPSDQNHTYLAGDGCPSTPLTGY